ncbi:hypothetical protein RhiXN_06709 [Rhizoctonia solani]|uniref:DOCKER domain-containing protein n=1 Tax=Rhizoctonia solani TaxID=456999 RepID=A0A8H8NZU9_9AGAM|nr:uncharacterized protein RhiXN_06709 [Rhizoctonia solani]QRW21720.1 hypothetical protein RhiXN_06709 [Rhizoctonia solani]
MAHKVILKMADPVAVMLTREFIPEENHADQFDAALCNQLVIEEFVRRNDVLFGGYWMGMKLSLLRRGLLHAMGYQITLASLVDPVLDLCLSHHDQLRNNAVQILYSMIVSEFHVSGHFDDIEHRLVNKLDKLYMSDTKGDDISRSFFVGQLRGLFDSSSLDPVLRSRVEDFLDSVNLFLDLLMNVRELPDGDEYQDDRVIATLRLMNYTRKIGRDEMYIKYVHQLVNMHLNSENYVEAALTLKLHADLHEWDMHAKELYLLIIEYLSKATQHAEVSFDYRRLAEIMVHQAALLEHIVTDQRYYSEYFRVAFYGISQQPCVTNSSFFTRRFVPEGHTRSNDTRDVWTEKTVLTTEEIFPTVLRRSCVMDVAVTQLSPVENALQDVRQKTSELAALAHRYSGLAKSGATVSTNALSMALNAVVDAGAGGSVTLFREVFMGGDYLASHPDSAQSIHQLKAAIDNQVRLIDQCLALHEELCPAEMLPFHETLVRFFRKNFHDEIQPKPQTTSRTLLRLLPPTTMMVYRQCIPNDPIPLLVVLRSPTTSPNVDMLGHLPSASLFLFHFPSLRERIASPTEQPLVGSPPTPTHATAVSPTSTHLTPLQRNIAHLNKYGLSAPGAYGQNGQTNQPPASPDATSIGSLVNVGVGAPGRTHSVRDTSSVFSNRTKERLSRLGSLGWMKRDA